MTGYFAFVSFVTGTTRLGVGSNEKSVVGFAEESGVGVDCATSDRCGDYEHQPQDKEVSATEKKRHEFVYHGVKSLRRKTGYRVFDLS